jgi:hypothetical protein
MDGWMGRDAVDSEREYGCGMLTYVTERANEAVLHIT